MKRTLLPLLALCALAVPARLTAADEKPAEPAKTETPAAPDTPKPEKKELSERDLEKAKKEAEAMLKKLKEEPKKKLWEIVTKGSDDDLKATGLKPEVVEKLKAARPDLKGWADVLTNETLGKAVLKELVDYGASSKFVKSIEDAGKEKEKKEKDREREKKKERKEREKERDKEKDAK